MASTASITFTTTNPNYQGPLIQLAPNKTPLLNLILANNKIQSSGAKVINMSKEWTPDAAAQPSISESAAMSAQTDSTFADAQETNVKQYFKQTVKVSADKLADTIISGSAHADEPFENDAVVAQRMKKSAQMKLNMEYSFLNGTYQADGGSAATARQTRGILTACKAGTNNVDATGADLAESHIENAMQNIFDNGGELSNMLLLLPGIQARKLNSLYKVAPADRMVGGVMLQQIYTTFGILNVVLDPQVPTDEILLLDFDFVSVEYTAQNGDLIGISEKEVDAGYKEVLLAIAGIDYTNEVLHASIENLKTT